MSTRRLVIALFALALLCAGVLSFIRGVDHLRKASTYFTDALKNASFNATVRVGERGYSLVNGELIASDGRPISDSDRYKALRAAYALALARRAPILGIAGVDPSALASSTAALSLTIDALAKQQKNSADARAVSSLYPTKFLDSLAALERARRTFIATGHDSDEAFYEMRLDAASRADIAGAVAFSNALSSQVGTSTFRFPGLGGTITNETLIGAASSTLARAYEVRQAVIRQSECLSGQIGSCMPTAIVSSAPDTLPPSSAPSHLSVGLNPLITEVRHLTLGHSSCLREIPGPYSFSYGGSSELGRVPLWYDGEYYFSPTAGSAGPTMEYLRAAYGMDYSIVNPLEFYICPDVGVDLGNARSVLDIAAFATSHPQYARAERSALFAGDTLLSYRAAAYLYAALNDSPSEADARALEELLLEWQERSAGLDDIVHAIVRVDSQDAKLASEGVPMDVSVRTLFLTHSAFPSLFLTQNPSAGSSAVSLRDTKPRDMESLYQHMVPETELLKVVPRTRLLQDVSSYLKFEGVTN